MPGKRVTFADANIEYSPMPPTPSPSFSLSSLPSSTGPITPPSYYKPAMPLPAIGLVQINEYLGYRSLPLINVDVSLWHAITLNSASRKILPEAILMEPATSPPLPELRIVGALPWPLTIVPTTTRFVTLGDVLSQLYTSLRIPVRKEEFEAEPFDSQDEIATAFHHRVNRDRRTALVEERKGLKRVDFLKGRHRFMGLSSTKGGPEVWMLNVR